MKKQTTRVLVYGPLLLVVFWILLHRFDAAPSPDRLVVPAQNAEGLFSPDNGYFLLMALPEPEGRDIRDPELLKTYWDHLKPGAGEAEQKAWEDFRKGAYAGMTRGLHRAWVAFRRETHEHESAWSLVAEQPSLWDQIQEDRELWLNPPPRLNRLERQTARVLQAEGFEEVVGPQIYPDLLPSEYLRFGLRLKVAQGLLRAEAGAWSETAEGFLQMLHAGLRVIQGGWGGYAQALYVGRGMVSQGMNGLVELMNRPGCPVAVFEQILAGLPERSYDAFSGPRERTAALMARAVCRWADRDFGVSDRWFSVFSALFYQPNRTHNAVHALIREELEASANPRLLKNKDLDYATYWEAERQNELKGLWWLWNASGKLALAENPTWLNVYHLWRSAWHTKVQYDLLRTAARLQREGAEGASVAELLAEGRVSLPRDPFTGQACGWNAERHCLYSLGPDQVDNGGETHRYYKREGYDIALPVHLYVRTGL